MSSFTERSVALLLVDPAESPSLHANYSNERNFPCLCGLPVIDYLLTSLKHNLKVSIFEALVLCPPSAIRNFREYVSVRPMLSTEGDVALISCATLKPNIKNTSEGLRDVDCKLTEIGNNYFLSIGSNVLIDDTATLGAALEMTKNDADGLSVLICAAFPLNVNTHCGILSIDPQSGLPESFSVTAPGSASEASSGSVLRPVAVLYHSSHLEAVKAHLLAHGSQASKSATFLADMLTSVLASAGSMTGFRCVTVGGGAAAGGDAGAGGVCVVVDSTDFNSLEAAEALVLRRRTEAMATLPDVAQDSCAARIGLMGNPSDGFGGKTLSFLLGNFGSTVRIERRPRGTGVEITEPVFFDSLNHLVSHSEKIGYSNGLRLLQATCAVFARCCNERGLTVHLLRGMRMSYTTDIPRMVGLAGSSAIVTAAFRCLLKFHNLSLADLGLSDAAFAQVVLDVERAELGISAGLQDRVVQALGGLVHMDFTGAGEGAQPVYTTLDPAMLPEMYLAYDAFVGGTDSGAVHGTVQARWAAQDPELLQGMQQLGQLADQTLQLLQKRQQLLQGGNSAEAEACVQQLATLTEANFSTRRRLYGDAVVGAKNITVAATLHAHGLSAKFTGSGGALVCLRSDGKGWLSDEQERAVTDEMHRFGFEFVRIRLP